MALQGTLDTFALADLVRLLATTSKTGELAIDGDRGRGRLWFSDGQLVGGEPEAGDLVDVVFALLRTKEGEFGFHADMAPDEPREPQSALDALAAAEARMEEWRPVEQLVPSPAVALTLREELPGDEVTISAEVWRRLVAVAGGTTAGALGAALDLDEQATGFAVRDLVDAGLVEVGDEVVEAEEELLPVEVEIPAEPDVATILASIDPVLAPEPEPVEALAPVEPLAPVEGVDVEPPYSFGRWGDGPVPAPETQVEPTSLGPWEPLTAPAEPAATVPADVEPVVAAPLEPFAAADDALPSLDGPARPDELGSYAVDLDSQLGGAVSGHSYLGTAPEPSAALPEPLLGAEGIPTSDAAGLSAPPEPPAPSSIPEPGTGAADELAARRDRATAEDGWGSSDASPATPATDPADLGVPLDSLSPAAARALAAAASADDRNDDNDAGRRVLRRIISTGKG